MIVATRGVSCLEDGHQSSGSRQLATVGRIVSRRPAAEPVAESCAETLGRRGQVHALVALPKSNTRTGGLHRTVGFRFGRLKMHVLVTGAAGSGTSTLGEALASRWNAHFLEADSCYWQPTNPPFTQKRSPEERSTLLRQALQDHSRCVVAGSVMGWSAQVEDAFSLIIFLYVPTEVRLQRLEQREVQLFGKPNPAFLEWAAQYDSGSLEGRSLAKHNAWLATRQCQVVRLEGNHSVAELLSAVEQLAPNPSIESTSPGELRSAPHVKHRTAGRRPR